MGEDGGVGMQCCYVFRNKERCKEEAFPNSKYCIFHIDFPKDEKSEEFKKINELKKERVKEKINNKDFNFEGAKLFEVDFSGMKIEGDVNFIETIIREDALFNGAEITGSVLFSGGGIGEDALFDGAEITGSVLFFKTTIGRRASFYESMIDRGVWFFGAKIAGNIQFNKASIGENIVLNSSDIGGYVPSNITYISSDTLKEGFITFDEANIKGKITCYDTKFENPAAQEEVCRKARIIFEKSGDRERADYYFYREMEAKRKQKDPIIGFLELPFQYIFGYGVYPWRVIATWLLTVFSLAFVYWLGNGVEAADSLGEYIYFSVVTAATPGYGGYHPNPGFYQGLASFEAILGTFMWATFIVTFARKYMR